MKRVLSVLLAFAMILTLFVGITTAWALGEGEEEIERTNSQSDSPTALTAQGASFVSRSDGIWLWPLPTSYYHNFSDWAGCPGEGTCWFCQRTHNSGNENWGDGAHTKNLPYGHNGFDVGYNVPIGTPVYAAADGTAYRGSDNWRGNYIVVEHLIGSGWSYYTYYQHLNSFSVANGTSVQAGDTIGTVGNTGDSEGPHLHFGMILGQSGLGVNAPNTLEGNGWVLSSGLQAGRILVNPALNSPAGFPTGRPDVVPPLRAHAGSVMYTFNKSQVSIKADYASTCTPYQAYDYIITTNSSGTNFWSQPCNNNTDPSSEVLATIPKGTRLLATGLYYNTEDHYWYKVSYNGQEGYVYSNNVEFDIVAPNYVTKSGKDYPTTHSRTAYYPVDWLLTSSNLNMTVIVGRLIDTSTGEVLYTNIPNNPVNIDSRTYQLGGNEPINNALCFNLLPLGTFRCTVAASYRSYYVKANGSLDHKDYAATPVDFTFNVVEGSPSTAFLDLNGRIDGVYQGDISGFGTADIFINGQKIANGDDLPDFCQSFTIGTSYMITDIKPLEGYSYNGIYSGSYSGTVGSNGTSVVLDFTTINSANIPTETRRESNENHMYVYYDTPTTWFEAKAYCESLGGHLVSITSEAENTFVRSLTDNTFCWIGGWDYGTCSGFDRIWGWVSGEDFSYTNWDSDQPDNHTPNEEDGERFAHLRANGKWNDAQGHNKYGFVCEFDSIPISTVDIVLYTYDGSVFDLESVEEGTEYTLPESYPKPTDGYFSGWAFSQNAELPDLFPGDPITVDTDVDLYPVYVTHAQAISGEPVIIFNIEDFDTTGYVVTPVTTNIGTQIDTSYWTDWSPYSLEEVTPGDTVEVRTTPLFRYYYFLCPACGAHEPYSGTSDCGAQIPASAGHTDWFTTAYKNSNYQTFSYTTAKYFTTSLGDGQLWIFSSGNLNDTAIGTKDADSDAIVIEQGYSYRTYVEQYESNLREVTAYVIQEAEDPYSGRCGDDAVWTFSPENGVLTISGTGAIWSYNPSDNQAPWHTYRDSIVTVDIQSGITATGYMAFFDLGELKNLTMADSVTHIIASSFWYCGKLENITFPQNLEYIGNYSFLGCESISSLVIPVSVTKIDYGAFRDSVNLTDVYYAGTRAQWNAITIVSGDNAPLLNATVHCTDDIPVQFSITSHPEDTSGPIGSTVDFHVEATGTGLQYQWQYKTPTGTWKNSSSATIGYNTDTLTVVVTQTRNNYKYRCIVTDASGETLTSDAATLTVAAPAFAITVHPQDASGLISSIVEFHVGATGNGLQYQWQYRTPTGTWKNSSSATAGYNTDTLTVVVTQTRNNYKYRCVVTDTSGNSLTSDAATLTVGAPAITITEHPQDASGPINSTVTFHVEATGTGLSYQWQYKTPTGTWKNSSSATVGYNTDTLTVVVTQTRNNYQYRCVVTDASGNSLTSDAATLTVGAPAITITEHPQDASGLIGGTVEFHVAAAGTGLRYRWQYKTPTGEWKNSSSTTAGYNTDTLQVVVAAKRDGYQYRCVVTDASGETLTSDAAALIIFAIRTNPSDASGPIGSTVEFQVTATGIGLQYQWQYKTPTGEWKNSSSTTAGYNTDTLQVAVAAKRNGYQYRCVVTDAAGNILTSDAATLTVG